MDFHAALFQSLAHDDAITVEAGTNNSFLRECPPVSSNFNSESLYADYFSNEEADLDDMSRQHKPPAWEGMYPPQYYPNQMMDTGRYQRPPYSPPVSMEYGNAPIPAEAEHDRYYGHPAYYPPQPYNKTPPVYPPNPALYYRRNDPVHVAPALSTAHSGIPRFHSSLQQNPMPPLAATQSGISKPKRSGGRFHRRQQSSRGSNFDGGNTSMALLAPGINSGFQAVAPHVSERPPGGYYWAVILNFTLEHELLNKLSGGKDGRRASSQGRYSLRRRSRRYIPEKHVEDDNSDDGETTDGVDNTVLDDDGDGYEEDGDEYIDDDDDDDDDAKYVPRTVSLGKRARKRDNPIKHEMRDLSMVTDQQNIVPIQMCQPPLYNILPAYPHALDADPQPRTRKQSKYSAEQDQIILDLKSQNRPWVEIAKLANCHNHLAARNRYQVLIGQQGGGNFIWTNEDCAALQDSLDEGERAKWLFIAQELSRKLGQHFTIDMVHYKITSLFAENPQTFGVVRTKDPAKGGAPFDRHPLYEDDE